MERSRLVEELRRQNPWWGNSEVRMPENFVERNLMEYLRDELDDDIVSSIIGLRRSGKTTVLHALIKELVNQENEKNILYFSFDLAEQTDVREVLDVYSEEILESSFEDISDRVYVFFDEVQKLESWADHVKSYHDRGYDLKFVVTGSASMSITKGAGESLVGRTLIHRLYPFSFRSFLNYHDIEAPEIDFESSYPANAKKYRIKFNQYMREGGFPEMYEKDSDELLQQNLDLTLFRDVVNMFSVKRSDLLKDLFKLTAENTGQVVNYNGFADSLDTQYRTVKDYIQHLEDSFLIESSDPYFSNSKKSMRKNPKLYVADHAYNRLYNTKQGLRAETIAFNHLKRIEEPYFKKDPEVDIILPEAEKAFEIKYQESVRERNAGNLVHLSEDYDLYLISKNTYESWSIEGRTIEVIPLWMLCLMVDRRHPVRQG